MFSSSYSEYEKTARIRRTSPTAPSSISARRRLVCGLCRHMNASDRIRPARSAASQAAVTSSGLRVNGFSQRTCFPASTDLIDHSVCIVFGSEM